APHAPAAAEAQPPDPDVPQPGRAPELELAVERVALPVGADGRAEEVADLGPAVSNGSAGKWQNRTNVQLPERSCRPRRDAELERCDDPAWPDDPRELREGRTGIVDVA